MAQKFSEYLGVGLGDLRDRGVLDAVLGVDTHLFIDPHLLRRTTIPEFAGCRTRIEGYYTDVLRLLQASRRRGDVAWREAGRRLEFRELRGVSIGYSVSRGDGNAIGPILGEQLLETASEIVAMGIVDPNVFELIGLFEQGFGADRLSDMTLAIIKDDLFAFSARIANELGLTNLVAVRGSQAVYNLPAHPNGRDSLVLLPLELLRDLPVALSPEDIDRVVATNNALRRRVNELIGRVWRQGTRISKPVIRNILLGSPAALRSLLRAYQANQSGPYDVERDPGGLIEWYDIGHRWADEHPIDLALVDRPTVDDLEDVVRRIVDQFKRNIEVNGLNEHLYERMGRAYRLRHERYSQLLFYSVADTYCKANNLDVSREPNAGSGPVDFKLSTGYDGRVLVEVKLSSNTRLLHGFERQLPIYEQGEATTRSIYVIIRVTESTAAIDSVRRRADTLARAGQSAPVVIVIDGRRQAPASRRR